MENSTLVPVVGRAVLVDDTFNPVMASNLGMLGSAEALVTTSGVETVSCCHSLVATG